MELCVISSTTTTIIPFQSCLTRSLGSRLFQCDSLFLSRRGCSVLRSSDGRLKKPIRPLEISCASKKFGGGGGSRRLAASTAVEAEAIVKEDRLPADLQVTETKAANSSVRDFNFFFFLLLFCWNMCSIEFGLIFGIT